MTYYTCARKGEDWDHLVNALRAGGVTAVNNPATRASLQRLGYMTPAVVRSRYWGGQIPNAMALTKKGQKRALQIQKQIDEKLQAARRNYASHKRNRLNCKRL